MIKHYIGLFIAIIGAKLWQLAYGKERFEQYETLRWYEKAGCRMLCKGLVISGLSMNEQFEILQKLNKKVWEEEES